MISRNPAIKYVSASEINDYVYCARSWWLKKNGRTETNTETLNMGTAKHEALYQDVSSFDKRKNRIILTVIFFIILYIVFALFLL